MDDITVDDLTELAQAADQNDLAVAMRDVHQAVDENWPDDDAVSEATEDVVLPFHEEDRELAFTLGLTFGAWLEDQYPEDGLEETEDTVESTVEQSQSVTVEA